MNTPEKLEALKANVAMYAPEILNACNNYMICKAHEKAVTEIAREIETQVLDDNVYMTSETYIKRVNEAAEKSGVSRRAEHGRITKPFDTYKMTDSDFNDYLDKCYEKYLEAGIAHPKGRGYVPEAPAKEARFKAENALLDAYEKVVNGVIAHDEYEEMKRHWKYRDKLIELALKVRDLKL